MEVKENAYKSYIADCLRLMGENVYYLTQGQGPGYFDIRWADIDNPPKQDDRTGDDIAADVIKRAGLSLKGADV